MKLISYSSALAVLLSLVFLSCVRDLTCDCYRKKGARLIFAIQTDSFQRNFITEKTRYFPIGNYDTDTGHKQVMRRLRIKYDSLAKITRLSYFIGVQDSFDFDTVRIRGAQLYEYRKQGYSFKCWE